MKKKQTNIGWKILLVEIFIAVVGYLIIWALTDPIQLSDRSTPNDMTDDITLTWSIFWAWGAVIYILASIRIWDVVPTDKIGVRLILGIATDSVTAGPPVIPPFIGDIELFPTATAQREFPDEPANIFRALKDGDQNAPAGKTPPLRINFSDSLKVSDVDTVLGPMTLYPEDGGLQWVWRPGVSSVEKESMRTTGVIDPKKIIKFNPVVPNDGLATSRITAEVSHISRLRVYDAVSLVQTIAPHEETGDRLDEVFRQIEDEQTVALNSILTKISVAQAQANVDWLNAILFARVELRIKAVDGHSESWGIDLEGAALKPFGFNRSLNDAITGVAEARFAKDATITDAEAARKEAILKGEGAAIAARDLEQKTLEGKGKGLAAAAKETGLTPAELLGAEVAGKIGDGDGTVIIGEAGLAQLVAAGSAIAGGLKKKP